MQTPLITSYGLAKQDSRQGEEIKALEKKQKRLEKQLDKLTDSANTDSVVKQTQIQALEAQIQQMEEQIRRKQTIINSQQKAAAIGRVAEDFGSSVGKSVDVDI
ncbi:hypothetical protein P22_1727 [Propionispora sp. 2/2-37]|uniref:FlxA-like family protein n=1 Tax=Propionispora sp. 2/2-37 TaxID=1677858 RepID=UPI0006BB8869|nr:FlxA-like family protein [Propionispora sp. 2/2-37]CUH95653.1 hypothetical protein P22_1727 [Propionispora sp. 2/2-37]